MTEVIRANESERLPHAQVHLLYCDHSVENFQRIAEAALATRADIYGLETFGGTKEEKRQQSEEYTRAIRTGDVEEYISWDIEDMIVQGVAGTGAAIELIDMWEDHPEFSTVENAMTYYGVAQRAAKTDDGFAVLDKLYDAVTMEAYETEFRNRVMAEQIRFLVESNPGKKITVIAGAMHTGLGHMLADLNPTRGFIDSEEAEANMHELEKAHYNPYDQLVRAREFGRVATAEQYTRALEYLSQQ